MKRVIIAAIIVVVVGATGIIALQRFQSSPWGASPESAAPSGFVPEQYFICPDGSSHGPGVPTESIASWCKKNGFILKDGVPSSPSSDGGRLLYRNTVRGIEFWYPKDWEMLVNNPADPSAIDYSIRPATYDGSFEWPGLTITDTIDKTARYYDAIWFSEDNVHDGVISTRLYVGNNTLYITCALYLDQSIHRQCNQILSALRAFPRSSDPLSEFEFNYAFGVGEQNILYTHEQKYVKDMVVEDDQVYTMALTPEEKEKIRQNIIANNIFAAKGDYVQNCDEKGVCMGVVPLSSATLNVWLSDQHKVFHWRADYIDTNDAGVQRLQAVMKIINDIITAKEKEMRIPQPKGGYL